MSSIIARGMCSENCCMSTPTKSRPGPPGADEHAYHKWSHATFAFPRPLHAPHRLSGRSLLVRVYEEKVDKSPQRPQASTSLMSSSPRLSIWSDEPTEFSQSLGARIVSSRSCRWITGTGELRREESLSDIPDPSSSRSSTLSLRRLSRMAKIRNN